MFKDLTDSCLTTGAQSYQQGFMTLRVLTRIYVMSSAPWKKVCHNKRRGECGWEQRRRIFSRGRVAVFSTAGGICENIQDFWELSKT